MEISQPTKYFKLIWIWMAVSSIVLIEPSPYEIFFILCFVSACLFSYLSFSSSALLPLFFLALFLDANLISLLYAEGDTAVGVKFFLITLYLTFSWVLFVGLLQRYGKVVLEVIFSGYLVAALLAVAVGIAAYFRLFPDAEHFLYYDRAMGLFKDANVYGPFLVPALLMVINKFEGIQGFRQFFWLAVIAFLFIGVFLSFSRAAWGNCLISIFLYTLLPPFPPVKVRFSKIIMLMILLLPVGLFTLNQGDVQALFGSRLGYQSYDNDRFGTQLASIQLAVTHPLGIGPGQTEEILNYSTHSLYVRVLAENGLLGLSSLLGFVILTVLRSLRDNLQFFDSNPYAAIVTASLSGILFNSFFIDTLHWRHFWLLMALPWIPLESDACENGPDTDQVG